MTCSTAWSDSKQQLTYNQGGPKYSKSAKTKNPPISPFAMTQNAVPGMVKLVPASNLTEPRPFQYPGEPAHLEVPWELLFELKLKIYVKIIYSEHFLFFEIFWLLVIFETLFSEKCPFLSNFDKNLFLTPSSTHMDKNCSKTNF